MASETDNLAQLQERAFAKWEALQQNWRRRALLNKRMTRVLTYSSVVLSVVTATMAAMDAVPRWGVAIASGGAALAAALMNTTKAPEQWVLSRGIQNSLSHERFMYEQGTGAYGNEALTDLATVRLFSERISSLGLAGHNSWAGQVSEVTKTLGAAESRTS